MANEVYANGMEVACKAAAGKTIAAMPDVCLSPPSPPAGPVPIPYPNTAVASDTTDGSKTVQISGEEVVLKDKSTFKKSSGDEAATKSLGMGVVSHEIQGKVNFTSWSMDVKIEGENVTRHLDLTLHNEMSSPANTPPWLYLDSMAAGDPGKGCGRTTENVKNKCTDKHYKNDTSSACCEAKKCVLAPYGSQPECCGDPKKTKHHVVPDHCFKAPGAGDYYKGINNMSHGKGLCICVTGEDKNEKRKQHARVHKLFDAIEDKQPNHKWTFGSAKNAAAKTCAQVTNCSKACLDHQISEYYDSKNVNDSTVLRADSGGNFDPPNPSVMGTAATPGTAASLG